MASAPLEGTRAWPQARETLGVIGHWAAQVTGALSGTALMLITNRKLHAWAGYFGVLTWCRHCAGPRGRGGAPLPRKHRRAQRRHPGGRHP